MILPQPNLKAKDLPHDLLPHKEVVKEYRAIGQEYERSPHDRAYQEWYAKVNGKDNLKIQPIGQRITYVMRVKNSKGEYIVYHISLSGNDWKRNKIDFCHTEGVIENKPIWHHEIDPQTDQVIPETTQIQDFEKKYTVPFSKKKIEELSEYFADTVQFAIVDRMGKRQTCSSLEQFTDLPYEELIKQANSYMFTDYYRNKQLIEAAGHGGAR